MKFITSDPHRLVIKLEGWECLWSLRRKITIPRHKISAIEYEDAFEEDSRRLWRLGGVGLPGVLYAGHFYDGRGWEFLYLSKPSGALTSIEAQQVLVINTQRFQFRRLLLHTSPEQAHVVLAWWNAQPE